MPSPRLQRGDQIVIETPEGRTFGSFVRRDATYLTVRGSVGEDMGFEILVPHTQVTRIVILERRLDDD